mgnify:CR=1 FL=1
MIDYSKETGRKFPIAKRVINPNTQVNAENVRIYKGPELHEEVQGPELHEELQEPEPEEVQENRINRMITPFLKRLELLGSGITWGGMAAGAAFSITIMAPPLAGTLGFFFCIPFIFVTGIISIDRISQAIYQVGGGEGGDNTLFVFGIDHDGELLILNLDDHPDLKKKYIDYMHKNPCLEVNIVEVEGKHKIKDSEEKIMEKIPDDKPVCVKNPNETATKQFLGKFFQQNANVWIRVRKVKIGTQEPTTLDKLQKANLQGVLDIINTKNTVGEISSEFVNSYQPYIGGEEVNETVWLNNHAKNATIVLEVVPEGFMGALTIHENNFKSKKGWKENENSYEYVPIEEVPKEGESTERESTERESTEGGRKQTKHKKKSNTKKRSKTKKQSKTKNRSKTKKQSKRRKQKTQKK